MKFVFVLVAVVSLSSHSIAASSGDKGLGVDPNGGLRPAAAVSLDDGIGIDPNGGGPQH